jgi:hypothetical protein
MQFFPGEDNKDKKIELKMTRNGYFFFPVS